MLKPVSLSFHPELNDAYQQPKPHLRLRIRPHTVRPFEIQGDRVGGYFDTANAAKKVIQSYCRMHGCTATVKVYTAQAELYRTDEVSSAGKITSTYPPHVPVFRYDD